MSTQITHTRTALRIIFFILLLDVIGISLLWPVTALIVKQYTNDSLMLTLLTAAYSFAQFFAAPFIGKLGDIYGRRPVLIISLLGSGVGYIMFGFGGALWVLLIARLIDGFTAGNQSVAAAYIYDISTPETRLKNFTLFGMAWGTAMVLGPALGALFGEINLAAPAYFAAVLSFIAAILSTFFLPESLPPEHRKITSITLADINPISSILYFAKIPIVGHVLLVLCLFNFVVNGFCSVEPLFLVNKFDAQPWQLGSLLALAGIALVSIQKVLPMLVKLFGYQTFAVICLVILAVILFITFVTPEFNWLYGVISLRTIAAGFLFPLMGSLMPSHVKPEDQGALMGVNTALNSAMYVFGPLCAGAVYDYVSPNAPYWMGSIILLGTAFYLKQVNLTSHIDSTHIHVTSTDTKITQQQNPA